MKTVSNSPMFIVETTEPDYIGVIDIAEMAGVSRSKMRIIIASQACQFPKNHGHKKKGLYLRQEVKHWLKNHSPKKMTCFKMGKGEKKSEYELSGQVIIPWKPIILKNVK